MTTFAPDTQFGKYRILRLLGQGGMADVYEAEDTTIGRKVALKILPLAFARDEERARRFEKEIQACAQLDHPNIVSVFDVGEVDDLHYYSMTVLPGGDLKSRLKEGALAIKDALTVAREIASALDYAHNKGFVHRDVKPENILFGEDGRAVLTDFGIVRATTSGTRMTGTGLSIGTPHYMSPEQARGRDVDGRSDLYALGVVLYEMLTGRVPFDATDSLAIGIMHLQDSVPPLPGSLRQFQSLIDDLLAKDPDERYQSGAELIADLEQASRNVKIASRRSGTRVVKSVRQGGQNRSAAEKAPVRRSRNAVWLSMGAGCALVVVAGVYIVQDQRSSPVIAPGGGVSVPREAVPPEEEEIFVETTVAAEAGWIRIDGAPDGARVYSGPDRIGTGTGVAMEMPAGTHTLRVEHSLFETWTETVVVESDIVTAVTVDMQPAFGSLEIASRPEGASIWIDGDPVEGSTPLLVRRIEAGERMVELRLNRYRPKIRLVNVERDATSRISLDLQGGDLVEVGGEWLERGDAIARWLQDAEEHIASNRLMRPAGRNAYEALQQVLELDPSNADAARYLTGIAERYLAMAEDALNESDFERAKGFLENAESLGMVPRSVASFESRFLAAERAAESAVVEQPPAVATAPASAAQEVGRKIGVISELNTTFNFVVISLEAGLGAPPNEAVVPLPNDTHVQLEMRRRSGQRVSAVIRVGRMDSLRVGQEVFAPN
ncbi:MAG: protein kinase domain-containing protein [Wenzhouxiangella sp.]